MANNDGTQNVCPHGHTETDDEHIGDAIECRTCALAGTSCPFEDHDEFDALFDSDEICERMDRQQRERHADAFLGFPNVCGVCGALLHAGNRSHVETEVWPDSPRVPVCAGCVGWIAEAERRYVQACTGGPLSECEGDCDGAAKPYRHADCPNTFDRLAAALHTEHAIRVLCDGGN